MLLTLALMPVRADNVTTTRAELPVPLDSRLTHLGSDKLVPMGIAYLNRDVPDSAMICFTIVANRRYDSKSKDELKLCTRAIKEIGNLYKDHYCNYLEASKFYNQSLELARQYGFRDMEAMCLNHLNSLEVSNADIYERRPNVEDSILARYIEVQDMGLESGLEDSQLAVIANNIAVVSFCYDKVGQCRGAINKFLRATSGNDNTAIVIARLLCEAILEYDNGNAKHAIELIDSAIARAPYVNDQLRLNTIKFFMLDGVGDDEMAIKIYEQCEKYAREHDRHVLLADIYSNLMDFYRSRGNLAAAEKYEKRFLQEKNFVLTKGQLIDMNEQKFLLRIDEANKQAERLAYQNRIKARILWVITAFVLLLAASWLLIYRKYRQVKQMNLDLYRRNLDVLQAEQEKLDVIEQQQGKRTTILPLNDEQQSELLHRVFIVMETCPEVYQENFTLDRLAELTGAVRNYVSQVINDRYNCSFNNLLAEYRVKEACRRMHDKSYNNHTLEALGASVGIKSRSNFVVHFRRVTGMTPSAYWRMARNNETPQQPE